MSMHEEEGAIGEVKCMDEFVEWAVLEYSK